MISFEKVAGDLHRALTEAVDFFDKFDGKFKSDTQQIQSSVKESTVDGG